MEIGRSQDKLNPAEGFFDVSDEVYFGSKGLSNSAMGKILKSAAHFMVEPPQTPALAFGSLVHCSVLERDQLEKRFVRMPKIDRRTKLGKETLAAFQEEHSDKILVKPEDWDLCAAITQKVHSHPIASTLLNGMTHPELASWKTIDGVLCKAKADGWAPDYMLDLKTTKNSSEAFGGFIRSVYDYGYHRQAAHYLEMFYDDFEDKSFFFIAAEKDPPYNVNVFELDKEYIEIGRKQRDKAIRLYRQHFIDGKPKKNKHMGYQPQVHKIFVPAWMQKIEEDVVEENDDSFDWDNL